MKLTKRQRSGYSALEEEKQSSRAETSKDLIEKAGWAPSGGYQKRLFSQYRWSECPEEDTKDLDAIFESAPPCLQILTESYPNGIIALDSRYPIPWTDNSNEFTDEQPQALALWFQALGQHHRIHKIKLEMEEERKKIGFWRWQYWIWQDKRKGTRRAWERLGERMRAKRLAEHLSNSEKI